MTVAKLLTSALGSSGRGSRRPRLMGLSPEAAKGRAADQVGLDVEDVIDDGMG